MSRVDTVRFRFVVPWMRPVIRRLAKMAGVSPGSALRQATDQRALDGTKEFTVHGKKGYSASYDPVGRFGR